jgi:hypothetical protein
MDALQEQGVGMNAEGQSARTMVAKWREEGAMEVVWREI